MAKSYDIPTQDDIDVQLDFPTKVLSLKVGDDLIALDREHTALLATRLLNALKDTSWPKIEEECNLCGQGEHCEHYSPSKAKA